MYRGGAWVCYEEGDVLIGNSRPYLKKIWLADNIGGTNGDVLVIRLMTKQDVLLEYLYHVLASDRFFAYDTQYSKGTKMPRGDKEAVIQYEISLPPLSEQRRIVEVLDRFDALCPDLSSGLPAEISAKTRQYEYCREGLLAFRRVDRGAPGVDSPSLPF